MFPLPSASSAVGNPYSHMIRPSFAMPRAQAPIVDGYHRGEQVPVRFNIPTRYELFILGDGEKKVTEEIDTSKS